MASAIGSLESAPGRELRPIYLISTGISFVPSLTSTLISELDSLQYLSGTTLSICIGMGAAVASSGAMDLGAK